MSWICLKLTEKTATRMTSVMLFRYLHCYLWADFTYCSCFCCLDGMFNWGIKVERYLFISFLTVPVPIPDKDRKSTQIFSFTLLFGASKSLIKALKAFMKPCETLQRSLEIKIYVNVFNTTFWNVWAGRVKVNRSFYVLVTLKYKYVAARH